MPEENDIEEDIKVDESTEESDKTDEVKEEAYDVTSSDDEHNFYVPPPADPDIGKKRQLKYVQGEKGKLDEEGKILRVSEIPFGIQINSFEEAITSNDPVLHNTPISEIGIKTKDGSYIGLKDMHFLPFKDLTPEQFMVYTQREITKRGGKWIAAKREATAKVQKDLSDFPSIPISLGTIPEHPTNKEGTYDSKYYKTTVGSRKVVITGQRGEEITTPEAEAKMRKDLTGFFVWLREQDPNAILVEGEASGVDQTAKEIFMEVNPEVAETQLMIDNAKSKVAPGITLPSEVTTNPRLISMPYLKGSLSQEQINNYKNHPNYKALSKGTREKLESYEPGQMLGALGGMLRNFVMLTEPGVTEVVYWHQDLGGSKGTKGTTKIAHQLKLPVYRAGQQEQDFEVTPNSTLHNTFTFMKRPLLRPPDTERESYENALQEKDANFKPRYEKRPNPEFQTWKNSIGKFLYQVRDFEKYDDWSDGQGKLKDDIVKSLAALYPDIYHQNQDGQLAYKGTRDIFGLDKNNDRVISYNEMMNHNDIITNMIAKVDEPIGVKSGSDELAEAGYTEFKNGKGSHIMPKNKRVAFIRDKISEKSGSISEHGGLGTRQSFDSKQPGMSKSDVYAKMYPRDKPVGDPPKVHSDKSDDFDKKEVLAKMKNAARFGQYYDPVQVMRGQDSRRKLSAEHKDFLGRYVEAVEQMHVIPDEAKMKSAGDMPVSMENIKEFLEEHPTFAVADEAVILPIKLGGLIEHQDTDSDKYYGELAGYHARPQHHILARQDLTKKVLDIMANRGHIQGTQRTKVMQDAEDRLRFNLELQETITFGLGDDTKKYGDLDTMDKEIESISRITPTRYRLFLEQAQLFDNELNEEVILQYGSLKEMKEIGKNQRPYDAPHFKYSRTKFSSLGYKIYEDFINEIFPDGNVDKVITTQLKAQVLGLGRSYNAHSASGGKKYPEANAIAIERMYKEFKNADGWKKYSLRKTIKDAKTNKRDNNPSMLTTYERDVIYDTMSLENRQPRLRAFVGPKVRALGGMRPEGAPGQATAGASNPNLKYQFMRANRSGTKLTSYIAQYIPEGVIGWSREPLSQISKDSKVDSSPTFVSDTTGSLTDKASKIRDRIVAGEKIEDVKGDTKVRLTTTVTHTDPKKREEQEQALKQIKEGKTAHEIAREVHYQDGKTLSKEQTQEYMKELKSKREPFSEDTDKGVHDQSHFFRDLIEACESIDCEPSHKKWTSYADLAMGVFNDPKFDKSIYKKLNEDILNYQRNKSWEEWMSDTSNPPHTTLNSYKDIVDNMADDKSDRGGGAGDDPPGGPGGGGPGGGNGNEQVKQRLKTSQEKLYKKYNDFGDIVSWMEKNKHIGEYFTPQQMRDEAIKIQNDGDIDERLELIQKFGEKGKGGYFEEFSFEKYGGIDAIADGKGTIDVNRYEAKIGDFNDIMREYTTSLQLKRKLVGKTDVDNKTIDADKAQQMSRDWFNMCFETGMPVEESIKDICINEGLHVNALNAQLKDTDKIQFIIPDLASHNPFSTHMKFQVLPKVPQPGAKAEKHVRGAASYIGSRTKKFVVGGYQSKEAFEQGKKVRKDEIESELNTLRAQVLDKNIPSAEKSMYNSLIVQLVNEKREIDSMKYSRSAQLSGGRYGKDKDSKEWKEKGRGFNLTFGGDGNRGGSGLDEVRRNISQFSNESSHHNTVGGGIHPQSGMSLGGDKTYGESSSDSLNIENKGISSAVSPKPKAASEEDQAYRARLTGGPGLGADIAGRLQQRHEQESQFPTSRGEHFLTERASKPADIKYIDTKPREEMLTFGLSGSLGLGEEVAEDVDPITGEVKQKPRGLSQSDILGTSQQKGQGVSASISKELKRKKARNVIDMNMQDESKPHITHSTNIFQPIQPLGKQKPQYTNSNANSNQNQWQNNVKPDTKKWNRNDTNPNDTVSRKKREFGMGLFS